MIGRLRHLNNLNASPAACRVEKSQRNLKTVALQLFQTMPAELDQK